MAAAGSGHDMVLRMLADTNQYLREIRKAQTATHAFRDAVSGVASFVKDAMSTAFGVMGGNFLTGMVSGIGSRIAGWVETGFQLNAVLEESRTGFGVMFRDVGIGNALVEQLYQYAAKTVYEFENVNKAAQSLAAAGVASNQIMPVLKVLGELGNTSTRPIEEIAALYAKIRSGGRITGEELRQFTHLGIPIIQELSNVLGKSKEELRAMVEAGLVSFPQFQQALLNLTQQGGLFYEMQRKLSETVPGIWATMKDSFRMAMGELAAALVEVFDLKELMKQGVRLGDWFSSVIKQWTPIAKAWWVWFRAEAANTFWDMTSKGLTFVASLIEGMTRFGSLLESVLTRIESILKSIAELLPKLPKMPGTPTGKETLSSAQSPAATDLMNELGVKPNAKPPSVSDTATAAAAALRKAAAEAQGNVGSGRFLPPLPAPVQGPEMNWGMRVEAGAAQSKATKEHGERDILAKALSGKDAYQAIYDAMKEQANAERQEEIRRNTERTAVASEATAARMEAVANDFNLLASGIAGGAM